MHVVRHMFMHIVNTEPTYPFRLYFLKCNSETKKTDFRRLIGGNGDKLSFQRKKRGKKVQGLFKLFCILNSDGLSDLWCLVNRCPLPSPQWCSTSDSSPWVLCFQEGCKIARVASENSTLNHFTPDDNNVYRIFSGQKGIPLPGSWII